MLGRLLALSVLHACTHAGPETAERPAAVLVTPEARTDAPVWVAGGDAFAFDLYQRLRVSPGNLFFAPGNLRSALAMTYAGAAGTTAQEMARTLHFESLPGPRLHAAQAAAAADLGAADSGVGGLVLRAANRLWGAQGEPFVPAFLELTRTQYDAELVGIDFAATEHARQTINAWVSKQTEGKIAELLAPQAIGADTRLVLTSAIYFKGAWAQAFDPAKTQARPFAVPGLAVAPEVPTMQQQRSFPYAEVDGVQVLELPYVGGRLAMTIVLPGAADGLPALEAALSAGGLAGWVAGLRATKVKVALPRFTTRASFELSETLSAMGMPGAFTGAADFSGMSSGRLQISKVIHEAFVDVGEAGTEAAAATAVVMTRSMSMGTVPAFTADRPFLYFIRDTQSGQVLFVGRVIDPRG